MEISVLNINGQETGKKVQLLDEIFAVEPSDHAMYLDVKRYLADQRQGTAKAKERSEMSGILFGLRRNGSRVICHHNDHTAFDTNIS